MAMNRRDFLKSAALTVAAGMVMGPTALAKEKTESVAEDGRDILNYNPKMKYRPMGQTGVKVSALGFGMLRLPMLADGKTIDMNQTVDMVHRAIDGGVNYIDTGRVYLGGQSELAVGKALANGWRDRVYVTSKSPWWIMETPDDFERMFDESRRAIGTDVIDFYHIHMIMHRGWKEKVIPFGLIEKIEKLKAQGKIRFLGFSFHDRLELFKEVVEAADWDFCLIQHNYLDYEYEAGVLGPKYAAANGMGLAVMKPARTGFLANLPESMREALASTGIHKPDNEWALDYLWDIPEVSVAVSGMGSMKDVEANLQYAAKAKPNMLTPDEREALGRAIRAYREMPGHVRLHDVHVADPARRPGFILYKLRPMPGQVPAGIGYSSLVKTSRRGLWKIGCNKKIGVRRKCLLRFFVVLLRYGDRQFVGNDLCPAFGRLDVQLGNAAADGFDVRRNPLVRQLGQDFVHGLP